MNAYRNTLLLTMALFFLTACAAPAPPTPKTSAAPSRVTATPPATATAALPAPTLTDLPLSPTPNPSPTPSLPTDTPAPASLNANGPYVLFRSQGGIWITNPDGSFPTQISAIDYQGDLRHAISPTGDQIALVVRTEQGLDLVLVKIPSGESQTIAPLLRITEAEEMDATSTKAFALYAIRDYPNLAWQPDEGRLLAFMGATNGPTSDLYLFNTETQEIQQLTSGPSQGISPIWSPDGEYLLHFGVSWVPPFGGAIIGANRLDGIWAVRVSDGKALTLPKPVGVQPNFVGWQDETHYLTYDSSEECFAQNLRSVDVTSGETTPILDFSFYYEIAQAPETGTLLFSSQAGCQNSLGTGIYLLGAGQTTPQQVLDKKAYEIRWLPESQVYFAYPEALFSSDGTTRYEPPVYEASYHPAVSKLGYQAWQVIENRQGRMVVKIPGSDWRTIFAGTVDNILWDPITGSTLLFTSEDGSLYAAAYPEFEPHLAGSLGGQVYQAFWLP